MEKALKKPALWMVVFLIIILVVFKPELLAIVWKIIRPVFFGMAIAFLMNPVVMRIERLYIKLFKNKKFSRGVSVGCGYVLALAAMTGIILVIVPNIMASFDKLMSQVGTYSNTINNYYNELSERDTLGVMATLTDTFNGFLNNIPSLIGEAYLKTTAAVSFLFDTVVGLIISIYILASKDGVKKGVKFLVKKFSKPQNYASYKKYYRVIAGSFSRFLMGQISEAIILGTLCFIGMKIFGFDYAPLISFIIGITALVPLVGAIAGAIPSAFLLFLNEPMSAVWFMVFLIVLQQIETHLIYPRVVGKSVGLPPLLIIAATIIGAGLGGVLGIVTVIPLTAAVYEVLKLEEEELEMNEKKEVKKA